jgi:hypothetical protein
VPQNALARGTNTNARFRFCTVTNVANTFTGQAPDGDHPDGHVADGDDPSGRLEPDQPGRSVYDMDERQAEDLEM